MTASLERTCKTLLDSLLSDKKMHVLCLNINEPGFSADAIAADYLGTKGVKKIRKAHEPTPTDFEEILSDIAGQTAIVTFDDLDKHPKCIELLAAHVQTPHPDGHLIVVSRQWDANNTTMEKELRRHCLFYQQSTKVLKADK